MDKMARYHALPVVLKDHMNIEEIAKHNDFIMACLSF